MRCGTVDEAVAAANRLGYPVLMKSISTVRDLGDVVAAGPGTRRISDEAELGFAFPKEQREWLIGGDPEKFMLPAAGDLRYNWVLARLAALAEVEMRELVLDAWRMVVPKRVAALSPVDGVNSVPKGD